MDLVDILWLQPRYLGFKFNEKLGAKWQSHYSVTKWNKEAQLCDEIEWLTSVFISISSSESYFQHFLLQPRYINQIHFWYILLEKLLKRDISTKSIFDISRSSNYSSEIYLKNPIFDISCSSNYSSEIYHFFHFFIYLARVISRARYINQFHFRYISLE